MSEEKKEGIDGSLRFTVALLALLVVLVVALITVIENQQMRIESQNEEINFKNQVLQNQNTQLEEYNNRLKNYAENLRESYKNLTKQNVELQKNLTYAERFEMCVEINRSHVVAGIYFQGQNYYCVWTKGYNQTEIKTFEHHEICHDLVYKDYNHFCDGYKEDEYEARRLNP